MRDRRTQLVFLGFILGFPLLMTAASPEPPAAGSLRSLLVTEAMVVVGLGIAFRERGRLLSARTNPAPRPIPTYSRAARRVRSRTGTMMADRR